MDLGRGILETGVLKMVSSHSRILLSYTYNISKEKYWEFTVIVVTVEAG